MANYYCADVIVNECYITIHFYILDGKQFRYVNSSKCNNFNEVFDFLFTKGISGYFKELIIYLEEPLKEIETNQFLKRAVKGLNWLLINSEVNAGILKKKFKKPAFIKTDY
ncbi:hypothetical protein MUB24_18715 [Lederbergia sp. NSJ-179]|uniref:hypothetical protein n=1 Tax=Lederbergia sp. NSJ-179 TaxID=2931402 RepID=UPI001FD443D6|nr:hypothetical protein [Lederbergia sp. NSJ-179]MCJ7842873.1 hypothetical protein [Lederbergia sp. NSJ-179]